MYLETKMNELEQAKSAIKRITKDIKDIFSTEAYPRDFRNYECRIMPNVHWKYENGNLMIANAAGLSKDFVWIRLEATPRGYVRSDGLVAVTINGCKTHGFVDEPTLLVFKLRNLQGSLRGIPEIKNN